MCAGATGDALLMLSQWLPMSSYEQLPLVLSPRFGLKSTSESTKGLRIVKFCLAGKRTDLRK
jgi:hypothetical protein